MIMSADNTDMPNLGGDTKTVAKTCRSGTVNCWAAIIFAPFLLHE